MKLRIQGNSIRMRLNQSDIEKFHETGIVEERVEFGNGEGPVFHYSLEKYDVPGVTALFEGGRLTVCVPQNEADTWAATEQVGIEGSDGKLRLLVEKDFACLTSRPHEDESDNFPHPRAS